MEIRSSKERLHVCHQKAPLIIVLEQEDPQVADNMLGSLVHYLPSGPTAIFVRSVITVA